VPHAGFPHIDPVSSVTPIAPSSTYALDFARISNKHAFLIKKIIEEIAIALYNNIETQANGTCIYIIFTKFPCK
ncbi:hypothetical protein MHYMCMPASI_00186, partial [Hyalomma marginatum]